MTRTPSQHFKFVTLFVMVAGAVVLFDPQPIRAQPSPKTAYPIMTSQTNESFIQIQVAAAALVAVSVAEKFIKAPGQQ